MCACVLVHERAFSRVSYACEQHMKKCQFIKKTDGGSVGALLFLFWTFAY